MTENTEQEQPKKRRRWPWITLVVILAFIAVVRLALRADFVFDFIRVQVEQVAGENLEGELHIQNMRGDLWSHIEIRGVMLSQDAGSDTVATIDTIKVGYNILSLLSSPFVVRNVDIFGLNSYLVQDQDSIWNFERLLGPSEPEEDAEGDPFPLRVERVELHNSNIYVNAPLILPDTSIQVREINMLADFELYENGFRFGLDNLGLDIHEGRFREPLRFETTASGDTTSLQLDRLMLAGASSFFEMMGSHNMETGEVELNALLDPLAWRTIRAYAEDAPLSSDISMRLILSGSLQDLQAQLVAEAEGMEHFSVEAGLVNLSTSPALTRLTLDASNVNFSALLGDPEMPSIESFESSFEGHIPFEDYQNATLDGFMTVTAVHLEPYSLERIAMNLTLREDQLFTNIELNQGDGLIFTDAHVLSLYGDEPEWSVDYRIERLNPALWAADEELEGMIQGAGSVSGRGFEFGEGPIRFHLDLAQSHFQDQQLDHAQISGWVNNQHLHVESEMSTARNTLFLNADAEWAAEEPTYSFAINTRNFDLSEFMLEDTLTTQLNLNLTGQGKNFDLETMELSARMDMDSSWVNNELIESLGMEIGIRDSILVLDDLVLRSSIATADMQIRQNILRMDDLNNTMDFQFTLLDLQPFAEMAGAELLQLQGTITGQMRADRFQRLALTANLDFQDVAHDTLTIESLAGRVTGTIEENPAFDADITINQPRFGSQSLNDIQLQTAGTYINEVLSGSYTFALVIDDENGLRQTADYHYANDVLRLTTNELELASEEGNYVLENPFDIVYANELVSVDTLSLRGLRTGAALQLAVDQYAPEGFRGHFKGSGVNLGLLQDVVLQEKFFEGTLASSAVFDINTEQMTVTSETVLSNFIYDGLELDSLQFDLDITDGRLHTNFTVKKDLLTLLASEFDLPFEMKEPEELSDEFFQEPVSGYIRMEPLHLEQFSSIIEELGYDTFTGVMALNSELSGTAGSPKFDGEFMLREAVLSGIAVEEVYFGWDYDHQASQVSLTSHLDTDIQRAFDLNGIVPVHVDFRSLEFSGPEEGDEITFTLQSTDLDLATFSDFMDPEMARDLRGMLNANISISGPVDDMAMEGYFRITDGRVRAVQNQVTFRNIGIDIGLEPGKIVLNRASVQSTGTFTASGEVDLDGFTPDDFNIRFDARNFQVFNTRDIDAYIGTGSRLHGSMQSPVLAGNLQVERGTVYLDDFGEAQVEQVELYEEDSGVEFENGFYDDLAMELNITITRNFYLRNRSDPEMNLALAGDLDLVKLKGQDMEVFGDVTIPSGHATTFGKRFDIDSGTLIFSGDPTNPQMDIRTVYRPRQQGGSQIEIYYSISGTPEEPEFVYSSEPEMEFQDIVSYTLFGRPFNALASWEQGAAGRSEGNFATDIAMELLLDRVEALASERLGIDVLEIDNTRRGPGSGTSIKAGKFITDRAFISFLQELGGTDSGRQVVLEYMLRRNLDLVITGSDDHRSGVDVLWRLDY